MKKYFLVGLLAFSTILTPIVVQAMDNEPGLNFLDQEINDPNQEIGDLSQNNVLGAAIKTCDLCKEEYMVTDENTLSASKLSCKHVMCTDCLKSHYPSLNQAFKMRVCKIVIPVPTLMDVIFSDYTVMNSILRLSVAGICIKLIQTVCISKCEVCLINFGNSDNERFGLVKELIKIPGLIPGLPEIKLEDIKKLYKNNDSELFSFEFPIASMFVNRGQYIRMAIKCASLLQKVHAVKNKLKDKLTNKVPKEMLTSEGPPVFEDNQLNNQRPKRRCCSCTIL